MIKAKNGELISNEKSSTLKLVLNDGYYYEDIVPKKYEDRDKIPFAKSSFKKYIINIDLSKLNSAGADESKISNTYSMLNVSELTYTLDSLNKNLKTDIISFSENSNQRISVLKKIKLQPIKKNTVLPSDLLSLFPNDKKLEILKNYAKNK